MNLKPFYDLLKSKLPPNEVLFMYHMPETVKRGILVLHSLTGARFDNDINGYKKAKFQLIIREVDFQSGYALAKQAMTALKVERVTQGLAYFHFINPLHDPVAFPKSAGDFIEFSVNFETIYTED